MNTGRSTIGKAARVEREAGVILEPAAFSSYCHSSSIGPHQGASASPGCELLTVIELSTRLPVIASPQSDPHPTELTNIPVIPNATKRRAAAWTTAFTSCTALNPETRRVSRLTSSARDLHVSVMSPKSRNIHVTRNEGAMEWRRTNSCTQKAYSCNNPTAKKLNNSPINTAARLRTRRPLRGLPRARAVGTKTYFRTHAPK